MQEKAQTQERDQDALKKYPGLMHSIIVIDDDKSIFGIVVKARIFEKISYILSGNSFNIKVITATELEHETKLGWDVNIGKNQYKLIVPDSEVVLYFEIPENYAEKLHANISPGQFDLLQEAEAEPKPEQDTGIPTPGSCNEYKCLDCLHCLDNGTYSNAHCINKSEWTVKQPEPCEQILYPSATDTEK